MADFKIDAHNIKGLGDKLKKLHKSAFPVAVRETLNDAAFYEKTIIPLTFRGQFTIRKKNFVRSHTVVNKTNNTFNINQMSSEVGIIQGKSNAGNALEAQETGTQTHKTRHIPFIKANKAPVRIGSSKFKQVSKAKRITKIKNPRKITGGKNPFTNQKFIKAAFKGGVNSYIQYNDVIGQVRKLKTNHKAGGLFIKFDRLYSVSKEKSFKLDKAPFIKPAGDIAVKKMPEFFKKRAVKRINRALK
jgi:hypothetical protein